MIIQFDADTHNIKYLKFGAMVLQIIICIYKAQLLSLLNPTKALRFCTHHAMCSQIETPAHDELTH